MSDPGKAVFLSYASQDAEAARRIAEALRAAGVEVWFDQSELRGGDAWDAKIRRQIKECALFVPVITPSTNARAEGYFRLEWKLAVDRSHLMADDAPFLFPIVVGDVSDATARVPDKFREVQWTRVRLDESPAELAARVARLLAGDVASAGAAIRRDDKSSAAKKSGLEKWWWLIFPIMGMSVPIIAVLKRPARPRPEPPAASAPVQPAKSEARQLAQRAMAMSVDKYNSTAVEFATAEGLIKRALELDQNDAEIWAASSMLHTNIRTRGFDNNRARREWARRDAERALKLDPHSLSALFALGRSQRDSDPVAAEATFKRLLSLNPDHAGALGQLGWLSEGSGRIEEAIKLYDRVLELDPAGAPLTHYVRFLMFFHYSRFPEAEQAIRRSVELQPSANSVAGLAMWLITAKGDAGEAARVLAAAPEEFRNEPRIIWVEATVHLQRRDPQAVHRTLSRLSDDYIQDNWFSGPKSYFAGLAHAEAGRHEAARVEWQSALAMVEARLKETPGSWYLNLNRGQLLAWLGQTDEARRTVRLLDEMQRGDSDNRLWVSSKVLILAALGDADAALPILRNMLEADRNTNVGWPLTRALLRLDPRWDKLRGDPRFRQLCDEPKPVRAVSALVLQGREMLEKYTVDDTQRETLSLAEELAKRAVQADVTDADAWSLAAQVDSSYIVTARDRAPARFAALTAAAEKAMQLAPDSDEALLARAIAYRRRAATREEAERILRELVQRHPGDRRILRALGNTLRTRSAHEDALTVFRQSAALPGGDARAELYCAEVLQGLGRLDEAAAAADRSFAVQPTGSVRLFKVNLARLRGDLALARAELAQTPPAVLLDDRGAAVAANVWLWSREPEKVIAALEVIPGDDLYNAFFYGPKSLMLGFAHDMAGRSEVAKVQWRIASKNLDERAAADPMMALDPLYLGTRMFLDFLIGDPEKRAGAMQMLRVYMQMGVVVDMDPAWDPAKLFTLLGRQDVMIDLAEIILKSGEMPQLREQLRTDKRYDPLRGNPRFEALLAEPKK
jgi:tetratricopeptide (TPR) repeat protein